MKKRKAAKVKSTRMLLWRLVLTDPKGHRERKHWVTEMVVLATTARGAELTARREEPLAFRYDPSVEVERHARRVVTTLTYRAGGTDAS